MMHMLAALEMSYSAYLAAEASFHAALAAFDAECAAVRGMTRTPRWHAAAARMMRTAQMLREARVEAQCASTAYFDALCADERIALYGTAD